MRETMTSRIARARIAPAGRCRVAHALAQLHDAQGKDIQITMAALAAQARLSKVAARQHVHALIADGVLNVVGNAHGGAPGAGPVYRFNPKVLEQMGASSGDLFSAEETEERSDYPHTINRADGTTLVIELRGKPSQREVLFWRLDTEPTQFYGSLPLKQLLLDPRVREAWDGRVWLNGNSLDPDGALQFTSKEIAEMQEQVQCAALGRVESVVEV